MSECHIRHDLPLLGLCEVAGQSFLEPHRELEGKQAPLW